MREKINQFLDSVADDLFPQYPDGHRNYGLVSGAVVYFAEVLAKSVGYQEALSQPLPQFLKPLVYYCLLTEFNLEANQEVSSALAFTFLIEVSRQPEPFKQEGLGFLVFGTLACLALSQPKLTKEGLIRPVKAK